jgi:peptidoglycan/LPS O-acetylase OafA/YrhL
VSPATPSGRHPDALTPPPLHPRFPLADGLRGLASMAILLVHVYLFSVGPGTSLADRLVIRLDVVLPMFFVLSAFLLYRPMIAKRAGGPRSPRVRDYFRGRALRIYPAYWLALTALAIFPGLAGVFEGDAWRYYTLLSNYDPAYDTGACIGQQFRCGLPQSWSLTTELTFYLALPLYAIGAGLLARGREVRDWVPRELALIAGLIVVSLILGGAFGLRNESWFRFSFLGTMIWFGLGLALAIASVAIRERPGQWRPGRLFEAAAAHPLACWLGAVVVYLVLVVSLQAVPFVVADENPGEYLASHVSFSIIALLALIPVLFGNPNLGSPRKLLARPTVLWLGAISYGTYLWHVTIAYDLGFGGGEGGFWVVLVGTLAISIPLAAASYYLLERPLMSWKGRRQRRSAEEKRARAAV